MRDGFTDRSLKEDISRPANFRVTFSSWAGLESLFFFKRMKHKNGVYITALVN